MKIFKDFERPLPIKDAVVTTGSFDGVHVGHKVILNRLNALARQIGGESVLVTFHPHPRKILYPETAGKELRLISSQREKIELLQKTGLDCLLIVKFTLEFSQLSSIDFIRKILVSKLHTRKVVVGFNHHFGHNREGDYEHLHQLGKYYNFEVEEIPQQDIDNETVSSTKIRQALIEGRIQRANAYLDHFYIIIAELEKTALEIEAGDSKQIYRVLIDEDVKLIPSEGLYAVSINYLGSRFRGMLNIKNKSQLAAPIAQEMNIGLHLFDCPNELHKETVTINFHKRMRDELIFANRQEFDTQLKHDIEEIKNLIY